MNRNPRRLRAAGNNDLAVSGPLSLYLSAVGNRRDRFVGRCNTVLSLAENPDLSGLSLQNIDARAVKMNLRMNTDRTRQNQQA